MTAFWADAGARARGLSTRLLGRSDLADLAAAADLPALSEGLAARGLVPSTARTPRELEHALRRLRADRLEVLARWCGKRTATLAAVFEDEDRRSVVLLLRRAGAGEEALAGLIPTPLLPERALATLAAQPTPRALAALLAAWGHPFGPDLVQRAVEGADLATLEQTVHRTFAARATVAARRGDAILRAHVAETLDVENALALWVGLRQPPAARDAATWLPGGARIDAATYAQVLSASAEKGAARLRAVFAGTPLAEPLFAHPPGDGRVEGALLAARIRALVRTARRDPLGTAPILAFALRQRAEALDLREVVWGVALGAPSDTVAALLVTQ